MPTWILSTQDSWAALSAPEVNMLVGGVLEKAAEVSRHITSQALEGSLRNSQD